MSCITEAVCQLNLVSQECGRQLGIECEPIRVDDYTGKKMTFFHDPDGLPLELHE